MVSKVLMAAKAAIATARSNLDRARAEAPGSPEHIVAKALVAATAVVNAEVLLAVMANNTPAANVLLPAYESVTCARKWLESELLHLKEAVEKEGVEID